MADCRSSYPAVTSPLFVLPVCQSESVSQRVAQAVDTTGEPLLTVAARRVGLRHAFKALTFMAAWQRVERALGHEPTMAEYCEWWRESTATAYRHRTNFLNAFPDEQSPSRLLAIASKQWDERHGIAALGEVLT